MKLLSLVTSIFKTKKKIKKSEVIDNSESRKVVSLKCLRDTTLHKKGQLVKAELIETLNFEYHKSLHIYKFLDTKKTYGIWGDWENDYKVLN